MFCIIFNWILLLIALYLDLPVDGHLYAFVCIEMSPLVYFISLNAQSKQVVGAASCDYPADNAREIRQLSCARNLSLKKANVDWCFDMQIPSLWHRADMRRNKHSQHWFRYMIVHPIPWANVGVSNGRFCGIYPTTNSRCNCVMMMTMGAVSSLFCCIVVCCGVVW